jgi:hypothetical protein
MKFFRDFIVRDSNHSSPLQQEGVDNISSINPLVIVSNYHVDLV